MDYNRSGPKQTRAWQLIAGYFGLYDGLIMEQK